MGNWFLNLFDEIAVATVYGGVILLVVLYALAIVSRRVRLQQSRIDELRNEIKLMGEEIETLANSMRQARGTKSQSLDGVLDQSRAVPEATDISWRVARVEAKSAPEAAPASEEPEVTNVGVPPPPRPAAREGAPDLSTFVSAGLEATNTSFPPPPSTPPAEAKVIPDVAVPAKGD